MMKKKIKLLFRIARISFYIVFFLAFIIIPTETFLDASICLTRNATGLLCPTCGVTRAFSSIMHFNFSDAYNFNPIFTIMICPICVFTFFQDIYIILKDLFTRKESYSLIEYLFII